MGTTFIGSSIGISGHDDEAEGFSRKDAEAVRFLLEKLECGLSLRLHYDYNWCLSLLVYCNRAAPERAFFLHRKLKEIHLIDVTGDDYLPVGTFASFIGAITFIQQAMKDDAQNVAQAAAPASPWLAQSPVEDIRLAAPGACVPLHQGSPPAEKIRLPPGIAHTSGGR